MSTLEVNTITPQSGTTLTLGGSGDTIQVASGVTNNLGITMADQWRLTADLTSNGNITSNLERVDNASFGYIGTGMTESSGQFTFPQTGKYLIIANIFADNASGDNIGFELKVTTDNFSSTSQVATTGTNYQGVSGASTSYLFNVTDVSNDGVIFEVTSIGAGSGLRGDTTANETFFTFIRLGD